MNGKQTKTIIILILGCLIFYFIVMGQINNKLVNLEIQITDLNDDYKKLHNKNLSMVSEIAFLHSITNLKNIAKEKNLKEPTSDQIIILQNDKNKES
ncbi:MAG: hypothetical protein II669_02085 [Elusimicrobia bacterium]|nr:hypothetical protein [Elusimicrobiota bacterium]